MNQTQENYLNQQQRRLGTHREKSNLPAVSIRQGGSEAEVSLCSEVIEQVMPGQNGYVVLLGGPTIRGAVREAWAKPLNYYAVPNPPDRTPEQLKTRGEIGRKMQELALADFAEKPPEVEE